MNGTLDRLAPNPTAQLHLALDLLLVSALSWAIGGARMSPGQHVLLAAVLGMSWLTAAAALRAYQLAAHPRREEQVGTWALQTIFAAASAWAATALLWLEAPSLSALGLVAIGLGLTRVVLGEAQRVGGQPSQRVVIVGVGALARTLAGRLESRAGRKHVLGFVPLAGESVSESVAARVLCPEGGLAVLLAGTSVDEVYVAGSAVTQAAAMQDVVRVCEELGMPFALPVHALSLERASPLGLDRLDFGFIHHIEADERPVGRSFKRLFDVAASGFALVVLSPLLIAVALLIRLGSPGPVFFRQHRVGMHGRAFNMLKFRSMVMDADGMLAGLAAKNEQDGPVFKMKNDPRVTPVGRFIRRYSIDELPQLVNILRGEMSVVGPRPPVPKEVARYLPWQRRRLSVRPGLTCHWQVSGRNNIQFDEWMLLDLRYIDQWSFLTDMKLIARTIPAVFTGHGAS